jgi:hypothetical protein
VWSMSIRLSITKPPSGKKAPAADIPRLLLLPPPAAFLLASTAGNFCMEPETAAFGYPRERLL